MAEYGSRVTELSAPSAAGANPISPVQKREIGMDLSPVFDAASMLGKALDNSRKEKAEADDRNWLSDLQRQVTAIDQSVQTGQLTAREADIKRRTILQSAPAARPHLITEISKFAAFNKEHGVSSDVINEAQFARKLEEDKIAAMVKEGIPIGPDTNPTARKAAIGAYDAAVRLKLATEERRAAAEEDRKAGRYNAELEEAAQKKLASQGLQEIGIKHFQTFNELALDLAMKVNSGSLDPALANQQIQQYFGTINNQITLLSASNPSLGSPFRDMFAQAMGSISQYLKPGSDIDALKRQVEKMKLSTELQLFQDPDYLTVTVASEHHRNNPYLFVSTLPAVNNALLRMGVNWKQGKDPLAESDSPIIGSKNEKQGLDTLGKIIDSSATFTGTPEQKKAMVKETEGMIRGVVEEYSRKRKSGELTKDSTKNLLGVLTSPKFGAYMKDNGLPPDVMSQLQVVFQTEWVSSAEQGFNKKILETVINSQSFTDRALGSIADALITPDASRAVGAGAKKGPPRVVNQETPVTDVFDLQFAGNGLIVKAKPGVVNNERTQEVQGELQKSAEAINKLVRLGAHLEGTTDYVSYWERNKHLILPGWGYEAPKQKAQPSPAPSSVKRNKDEEQMSRDVLITPEQKAPDANAESPDNNLRELEKELSKTKDPERFKILMQEYQAQMRRRNAR